MWLLRNYRAWLELVRELLDQPTSTFPRTEIQMHLASTLDTVVAWNWEDPDGSYGVELSHPLGDWPTAADREAWDSGVRDLHPLLCWFRATEDPRPMSLGRVPPEYVAPGAMEQLRQFLAPIDVDQQLSVPCYADHGGHRAFVAAKGGDDFSDEALALTRRIQPLLALLWLQGAALERCPAQHETFPLTSRERAVLQLLSEGLTAEAIGHRLAISPRTVHTHLAHVYRKLGVADRMRAVLVAEAAGLVTVARIGN
jgi:DNA-binding CsgD family transcriptional regulator